jgi:lipoprotein-anchoring transpeptidase ErfK/SrfK
MKTDELIMLKAMKARMHMMRGDTATRRRTAGISALAAASALALGGVWAAEVRADETGSAAVEEVSHGRVEVSIQARQVSFYDDSGRVATFPVAVGREEWPTRTGEWEIHRIDFNPDWTPPDEEWAEDREYKEPGHPDNPMGRIRIVYDPPRSIHGTDDTESIGGAESHGSIRIRNEDGFELARLIMAASGDERSEEWWENALGDESEMVSVDLSQPVPIRVREE